MAIFVTSDAHGHVRALDHALELASPSADDTIYVLGDMTDRGPDPMGVVKLVRSLPNAHVLMGNHERMLLDVLNETGDFDSFTWSLNGGLTTATGHDSLPHEEIGYNYRVSFDLDGKAETPGTELFRSQTAVFYLADPVRGMLGFARDGYLNYFSYPVPAGQKVNIAVEGDNKATRLYINGKLVETLDIQRRFYDKDAKAGMNYVRTLFFPLRQAGQFKSSVTNLKVEVL